MAHISPIIGYHRAPLSQKFGTPRQPNLVGMSSIIEMITPYDTPAAFDGLEAFSHIWISWQFHHNAVKNHPLKSNSDNKTQCLIDKGSYHSEALIDTKPFRAQVRPPRLGGNQKIGVFASRSMYRPSGLGLSVVKLESIDIIEGRVILVISGADMIDSTPVIDIKPYVGYSDALNGTSDGFAPMAPVPLEIDLTELASEQFMHIVNAQQTGKYDTKSLSIKGMLNEVQKQVVAADIDHIKALIALDPRPAYRQSELNTTFMMRYKSIDVGFTQIEGGGLQIIKVRFAD